MIDIYLDLNHWYTLGAGVVGEKKASSDTANLYAELKNLVVNGKVRFPLSTVHYMELTENPRDAQRTEAALVMAELSQFRTLAPMSQIIREEIAHSFFNRFGRPAFPETVKKIGFGVGFAFGEPRRLVLKGGSEDERKELEARVGMSVEELTARLYLQAEYWFLAGPSKELRGQIPEYDPYAARALADSYLKLFNIMIDTLRNDPDIGKRPLDAIAARELAYDVLDAYSEIQVRAGFVQRRPFHTKDEMTEFLLSLPSRKVAVMMKFHYLKDVHRDWTINDLRDIDALSKAIPYCDVVVTDKKAWDVTVNRAGLDREFHTAIFPSLEGLRCHLAGIDWAETTK